MKPKEWKMGVADEAWKVIICARDIMWSDDLIDKLVYVLTTAGNDHEAGLAAIRAMSGDAIVSAIIDYRRKAAQGVEAGMKRGGP